MQSLWPFLTRELHDAPGRANYTLRLTLSCAVLIVLFMTLHIPFLAVALIVVFYVSQPNVLMIKLVSVVFVVTVSVALGGVLLIIKWTYDYPLIRLVASVILFFCAIYLMRVLGKLGLDAPTPKDKGMIMKNLMPLVKGKADADGNMMTAFAAAFDAYCAPITPTAVPTSNEWGLLLLGLLAAGAGAVQLRRRR